MKYSYTNSLALIESDCVFKRGLNAIQTGPFFFCFFFASCQGGRGRTKSALYNFKTADPTASKIKIKHNNVLITSNFWAWVVRHSDAIWRHNVAIFLNLLAESKFPSK